MVVGIDLSSSLTGVALVSGDAQRVHLHWTRMVRVPEDPWRGVERILELIPGDASRVLIERPPTVVKSDVRHGSQAAIGYALGRMTGLLEGELRRKGLAYRLVEVRDWRATMLRTSTAWGVPATPPPPKPPPPPPPSPLFQRARAVREGGTVYLVWPCDHRVPVDPSGPIGDTACRVCAREEGRKSKEKPLNRAQWVSAEWKRLACRLVAAHWPEPWAAVVADARGRARTERAEHELAGVADAAEAAWIGVHGVAA